MSNLQTDKAKRTNFVPIHFLGREKKCVTCRSRKTPKIVRLPLCVSMIAKRHNSEFEAEFCSQSHFDFDDVPVRMNVNNFLIEQETLNLHFQICFSVRLHEKCTTNEFQCT